MNIKEFCKTVNSFEIVDLSHGYKEGIPIWPSHAPYEHVLWEDYDKGSLNYQLKIHEHCGTHVDSPAHFIKEGKGHVFMSDIPLEHFMGRCITLDFTDHPRNFMVMPEHIQQWEKEHIRIEENDIVMFNFGVTEAWKHGNIDYINANWSGLGKRSAEYLLSKKIKMVGSDGLALDVYGVDKYWVHLILLDNRILILENVANLDKMPDEGYFICLPLNVQNCSGSPIRAIGFKNKQENTAAKELI